jgi:hypothetical protein
MAAQSFPDALTAALQKTADHTPSRNATRLELLAEALVTKACTGDVQAIKTVFDRIDRANEKTTTGEVTVLHTFKSSI